MTSDEALKKWCPMARASNNDNTAVNRQYASEGKPDPDCLCIASGCAVWVWDQTSITNNKGAVIAHIPEEKWSGHCGMVR